MNYDYKNAMPHIMTGYYFTSSTFHAT